MGGISLRPLKKKAGSEAGEPAGADGPSDKRTFIEIDWEDDFKLFATIYGWGPEKVARLSLEQYKVYQEGAYAEAERRIELGAAYQPLPVPDGQHSPPAAPAAVPDDTACFDATAARLKAESGKDRVSLADVIGAMPHA